MKIVWFVLVVSIFCSMGLLGMTSEEYQTWWDIYRQNRNIPIELKEMEDHFINCDLIKYSSNYWNFLNKKNIEQITELGYANFKQTVAQNYFTWVVNPNDAYAESIIRQAPHLSVKLPAGEMMKVHSLFSPQQSLSFNLLTIHFLSYILNIGGASYLEKLEEPLIGNPPYLTYQDRRVSQDIFNSLLEYLPISRYCPLDKISTIIEVGAGSGRTAFTFITLLPHIKYVIVDFPPALYLSQRYLQEVFPNKKVMKFRAFTNFADVANEFSQADIIFLMPDQLEKLPDSSADLFLAIDCLHEMKPERIAFYFNEAERLADYFYFKCWQKTTVPYDGVYYTSESYPVHSGWTQLFNEPCAIPNDFFHAMYHMSFEEARVHPNCILLE